MQAALKAYTALAPAPVPAPADPHATEEYDLFSYCPFAPSQPDMTGDDDMLLVKNKVIRPKSRASALSKKSGRQTDEQYKTF